MKIIIIICISLILSACSGATPIDARPRSYAYHNPAYTELNKEEVREQSRNHAEIERIFIGW